MRSFLFWFLSLCAISTSLQAQTWPFDQRQILLTKVESQEFLDNLTAAQLMDVFVQKGRVRWVTQRANKGQIVPIEVPADFPWQSFNSVKQLGLKYKVDGIINLVVRGSEIDLRWYATTDGQPLFFEKIYLPSASDANQAALRKKRLLDWIDDIWAKIPGRGYVVKRDMKNLQIEGAQVEGLKEGDSLDIIRLRELRRHPILKTLVGIDSTPTGVGRVKSLGMPFSQVEIVYESDLDPIRDGDRYVLKARDSKTLPSDAPVVTEKPGAPVVQNPETSPEDVESEAPLSMGKFLDLDLKVGFGNLAYKEKFGTETVDAKKFGLGYEALANLYLTRNWLASLKFGKLGTTLSGLPASYGDSDAAASLSQFRVFSSYRMPMEDLAGVSPGIDGTELIFSAGYSRFVSSFEDLGTDSSPSTKTYSGIDIGFQMRVPVTAGFAANLGFSRILGAYLSEVSETSGENSSNSAWSFNTSVEAKVREQFFVGGGYSAYQVASDFDGAGTRVVPADNSKTSQNLTYVFVKYQL